MATEDGCRLTLFLPLVLPAPQCIQIRYHSYYGLVAKTKVWSVIPPRRRHFGGVTRRPDSPDHLQKRRADGVEVPPR
jgi:hypothetical protein